MKSDSSTQSAFSAAVSRREFLVGSMASIAVASLTRNAWADAAGAEARGGVSDAAFESARRRAAALVSRMTMEEVAGQVVNDAAAIPRLKVAQLSVLVGGASRRERERAHHIVSAADCAGLFVESGTRAPGLYRRIR